jgi:hypothetical protein
MNAVNIDFIRQYAMSLEAVTEEPHHHYSSFRVRGKIFITVPPAEDVIHVFVEEEDREPILAMYPDFIEKLFWGAKVVGLKIVLKSAIPDVIKSLISKAYETKARKNSTTKSRQK